MIPPAPTYPDGANTPHGAVSSGRQARVHHEGPVEVFPGGWGSGAAPVCFVTQHNPRNVCVRGEAENKLTPQACLKLSKN